MAKFNHSLTITSTTTTYTTKSSATPISMITIYAIHLLKAFFCKTSSKQYFA